MHVNDDLGCSLIGLASAPHPTFAREAKSHENQCLWKKSIFSVVPSVNTTLWLPWSTRTQTQCPTSPSN